MLIIKIGILKANLILQRYSPNKELDKKIKKIRIVEISNSKITSLDLDSQIISNLIHQLQLVT